MKPNKKHKDSIFSVLFNNPEALRELYSAIEGIPIPLDMRIDINTLSNVLIRDHLNDLSFTIDNRLVVLIEHQSTISDNLPLRLHNYIGKVYQKNINYKKRFKKKLVKIPRPEFIVLYNGKKAFPDHKKLRLSDAFMDIQGLKLSKSEEKPLELIAHVYNINQGHNPEILKKSKILNDYSFLISKIWDLLKRKLSLEKSLEIAIKYCIENNILYDFLNKHGSEVYNMLYDEYRFEDELEVAKEEAKEDGHAEGFAIGHAEGHAEGHKAGWEESRMQEKLLTARNLLAKNSSLEFIHEITGLDIETIQNLMEE